MFLEIRVSHFQTMIIVEKLVVLIFYSEKVKKKYDEHKEICKFPNTQFNTQTCQKVKIKIKLYQILRQHQNH